VTGDKLIKFTTAVAVTAVAAIAAVVSYSHIYDLGRTHGQSGAAARLLPLSVDGLIMAASLTLLLAARNGQRAPALPRFALWLGIGGTVAANLAYGLPYGPVGAVLSAWPGAAFVLAIEILLGMLRRLAAVPETVPENGTGTVPDSSPGTVQDAVPEAAQPRTRPARQALPRKASRGRGVHRPEVVFAAELEAGRLPGIRAIKRQCRVGQDRAKAIRDDLAALIKSRMSEPTETMA
jgi:Protein of unknown function (DUF2637)